MLFLSLRKQEHYFKNGIGIPKVIFPKHFFLKHQAWPEQKNLLFWFTSPQIQRSDILSQKLNEYSFLPSHMELWKIPFLNPHPCASSHSKTNK